MAFSENTIDALTEVINIGVGKAANSLNEITDHHVALNVPKVEIFEDDIPDFNQHLLNQSEISSVQQNFDGKFSGSASLLFPEESARKLIASVTGEKIDSPELDSIRSSTLLEIGNIVINAIMGTISNLLESSIHFSLPEYRKNKSINNFFQTSNKSKEKTVLVLAETNFSLEELEINGFIFLIFEVQAINLLIEMTEKYIHE